MLILEQFTNVSDDRPLQVREAEVEVRPEKDQRPEGRCHHRREHLREAAEMGVVGVLGGDENADHYVSDGGQAGHPMRFAGRRRLPATRIPWW